MRIHQACFRADLARFGQIICGSMLIRNQCCGGEFAWIRNPQFILVCWRENYPRKEKKVEKNSWTKVLDFLFWGMEFFAIAWTSIMEAQRLLYCNFWWIIYDFLNLIYLRFLVIRSLDLDPVLPPDPHWNQCGSKPLSVTQLFTMETECIVGK